MNKTPFRTAALIISGLRSRRCSKQRVDCLDTSSAEPCCPDLSPCCDNRCTIFHRSFGQPTTRWKKALPLACARFRSRPNRQAPRDPSKNLALGLMTLPLHLIIQEHCSSGWTAPFASLTASQSCPCCQTLQGTKLSPGHTARCADKVPIISAIYLAPITVVR